MTHAHQFDRLRVLPTGADASRAGSQVSGSAVSDPRVGMVLEVLAGRRVEHVATDWGIDSSLLHRWTHDFVLAGAALVTNRPDPEQSRQRDRLIAALAHELRTPIAVAGGWATILSDGDVPDDQVASSLGHLTEAITRLSEHVFDMELAASVSLGRLRIDAEEVQVADLCRDLPGCDGVRNGVGAAVLGDRRLLVRVVRDLWANAHRDPAPDSVAIDVVEDEYWTDVRIERSGEPIRPTTLQALFDPFGANDDATGVTTGLYMARALVVAHGGILAAEGDDNGTTLIARLPRRPETPAPPTGQPVDEREPGRRRRS